jgi:DNA-binding transcriptional ArsR family regulator
MKPSAPTLTPLLRSDTQGRILAALYLFPEQERTASELARLAATSLPTVLRELDRLAAGGFVVERVSGRNRCVRVNTEHVLYGPVEALARHAYGPVAVLPGLLAPVPGIEEAYVYGSWAARLAGEPGPDPADVDVIVVGTPDRMKVLEVADEATRLLARPTNIRVVSRPTWDAQTDLFIQTVQNRPLTPLNLERTNPK